MSLISVVARHQLQSLRRQRVVRVMMGTMLAMTALAGLIGWSSHQTIIRVYDVAVKIVAAQGKPSPPNPFGLKPPLSLLSNMVVYVQLIGALLALVVGHLAIADDETGGIGRLVFSRPLSRTSYLFGKVVAAAVLLAITTVASLFVSVVALVIVNGSVPSLANLGRLAAFYALSWEYLMCFALIGMVCALLARRRSLAVLTALGVWLVVTFAVPQLTSGLRPTTSLNPINDPVSTSQAFFRFTAKTRAFSIGEQFKVVSSRVLQTGATGTAGDTFRRVLPLIVAVVLLVLVGIRLVQRHDYAGGMSSE
jgi:ABC-type transport system involved in multi-copper enzyme maturation permease subunit